MSDVLIVAGLAAIVYGLSLWTPTAAWIFGGGVLFVGGMLLGRRR